jgi:hypothetical protein
VVGRGFGDQRPQAALDMVGTVANADADRQRRRASRAFLADN